MYIVDLLNRRSECFVLWIPGRSVSDSPPTILLGQFHENADKTSGSFNQITSLPLVETPGKPDLWELDPKSVMPPLSAGIYHYWFQMVDDSPDRWGTMVLTDPLAFTVDYRVIKQIGEQEQPAAVIKYRDGKLWPCTLDGIEPRRPSIPDLTTLPSNNHLVIYELPTSWAKEGDNQRSIDVDVGTFVDVMALFDVNCKGDHFSSVADVRDQAILTDLGVNALELLPVADAKVTDEWGYATAHYFAPDYDFGPVTDLVSLVEIIHNQSIRFFVDIVMAFGHDPYTYLEFTQFHLRPDLEPNNPDSYQSHANSVRRDGYGGQSWRYIQTTQTYDPESGTPQSVHPTWAFHRSHLARWMADFGVGGLRLDSVNNIGNYDFVQAYKSRAWELYNARYGAVADPAKFLVIGEELSMPIAEMVHTGLLDALWNEPWQGRLRATLLAESWGGDNFEWTVRRLANCLDDSGLDGRFSDGAQAVNYITSHDIEGYRKERLYNFLTNNGVWDVERRAKLAFVLLLTSVGIPMIFAGEEFADQMDRSLDMSKKQTDPVNYGRKSDGGWREALFGYVANLVKFRTKCPALGEDDTDFFHVDESRGGKILAWRRGEVGNGKSPVVVVANFTDEETPGVEYVVPNWPEQERTGWREVTQGRDVPTEWVGREPLMQWEAKVYTCWSE